MNQIKTKQKMLLSWHNAYLLNCKSLLVQSVASCKSGMMLYACKHSTEKVGVRGWEVQGHPQLQSKFETLLATWNNLITLKL